MVYTDKTIIYYTSNRESPVFEEKIRKNILDNSCGLPIISVSQKPINLGKNICVGEVGHSYLNTFRQILIAAKAAKTKYLIFTEADFLYPKKYFTWQPQGGNLYRYDNVWIVFKNNSPYYRKIYSNGAQIAKREFIIKELEKYLEGQPQWADGKFDIKDKKGQLKKDYNGAPFEYFSSSIACVSFKTGNGMTKSCSVMHGTNNSKTFLPYWGNVHDLRKKYI